MSAYTIPGVRGVRIRRISWRRGTAPPGEGRVPGWGLRVLQRPSLSKFIAPGSDLVGQFEEAGGQLPVVRGGGSFGQAPNLLEYGLQFLFSRCVPHPRTPEREGYP